MLQPGEDPPSHFHLSCQNPNPLTPAIPSSPLRSFRSGKPNQTESSAIRFPQRKPHDRHLGQGFQNRVRGAFFHRNIKIPYPLTSPRHHQQALAYSPVTLVNNFRCFQRRSVATSRLKQTPWVSGKNTGPRQGVSRPRLSPFAIRIHRDFVTFICHTCSRWCFPSTR